MGDYPSEATLKLIAEWDIVKQGIVPLVSLVADIWHWEDYCIWNGNSLQLHTGGWSGNEDIICALKRNGIFWSVCWKKSTCGGHYWFEVKELKGVQK